jgi:integrase
MTNGRQLRGIVDGGCHRAAIARPSTRSIAILPGTGRTGLLPNPRSLPKLGEVAPDFFARRKRTHRAGAEDGSRWKNHLAPHFAHLRPTEVDAGRIRAFIEAKLAEGVNPATIRIEVAILSALFTDLAERGIAAANPSRNLPRSIMRLMRPTHDPRTTPFIERLEDVRRIHLELPRPLDVAYAIGALAGLRTGEVFALKWAHVDLAARRIHVRESVKGPLKDKDSRMVPILDPLRPILTAWREETGGEGLLIPPIAATARRSTSTRPARTCASRSESSGSGAPASAG